MNRTDLMARFAAAMASLDTNVPRLYALLGDAEKVVADLEQMAGVVEDGVAAARQAQTPTLSPPPETQP